VIRITDESGGRGGAKILDAGSNDDLPDGTDWVDLRAGLAQAASTDAGKVRRRATAGIFRWPHKHLPGGLFTARCLRQSLADCAHDSTPPAVYDCTAARFVERSFLAAATWIAGEGLETWVRTLSLLEGALELWPEADTSDRLLGRIRVHNCRLAFAADV